MAWTTGSGVALPDTSGSTTCSSGLVDNCISGGGEPVAAGLSLRLGECDRLRFLSRLAGDLRRGDGDLVFRLDTNKKNWLIVLLEKKKFSKCSIFKEFYFNLLGLLDWALSLVSFSFLFSSTFFSVASFSCSIWHKMQIY